MDINEQIREAGKFLDLEYKDEILEAARVGRKFVIVDYWKLAKFNPSLGDELLNNFEDTLKAVECAVDGFSVSGSTKGLKIRFVNFPATEYRDIWKIRADDIGKLIVIKGYIRKISDVLHGMSATRFECPGCGNIIAILQLGDFIKEPKGCGCGRKGNFRVLSREIYDLQKLIIEEDPKNLVSSTQKPRRMLVVLKNDLCREEVDSSLQPSTKIVISGLLKDKPVKPKRVEYNKYIEAHNIEVVDESFKSVKFQKSEIEGFEEVSRSPNLHKDMAQSIFPTIYGHEMAKVAIFLQLMGGAHLYDGPNLEERGTIHICLVGSPGSGKTQILKRAIQFIPNSRFTGGRGTSGVGLIAAVTKDEELGGWTLDAGAVPMCNKSMCAIDELDKMDKSDIAMMNNAMNDLKVSIDKANIHGLLETDTMILGAANPTNRVFDKRESVWKQLGLPKDFLDRFDLVFPIETMESEDDQRKVAGVIFSKYNKAELSKPKYDRKFVARYIAYARQNFEPKMNPEVEKCITDNFINLVKPKSIEEDQAYFSSRLLTNIIRLSVASAKARLSNEVDISDAKLAVDILIDSLKKQDIISVNGLVDIEKLEAVVPKPKRDKMYMVVEIIKELGKKSDDGTTEFMNIIQAAEKAGIEEPACVDILEKLSQKGDVFQPRRDKYKVI